MLMLILSLLELLRTIITSSIPLLLFFLLLLFVLLMLLLAGQLEAMNEQQRSAFCNILSLGMVGVSQNWGSTFEGGYSVFMVVYSGYIGFRNSRKLGVPFWGSR